MTTITTWVLLVYMSGGHAGGITAIPGYLTKDDCETAAAALDGVMGTYTYCIPGPSLK